MSKLADKFWDDAFACMKTYPVKGVVSGDEIKALFDRHLAPTLALMERLAETMKTYLTMLEKKIDLEEKGKKIDVREMLQAFVNVSDALTDYEAWKKEQG